MIWVASSVLVAAVAGLSWILASGPAGLLYLVAYVAATMPGWPIGWWLFGRRHAAGWVAGALIGYGLTTWTIWLAIAVNERTPLGQLIVWALVTAVSWTLAWLRYRSTAEREPAPLIELPAWTRRDTLGLLLLLWLVPLIVARPFAHIGSRDADGNLRYRAYFTADVLWHGALTAELVNRGVPPTNPYAFDQHLHYYWTYFLVPAEITSLAPRVFAAPDYIPWLLINATGAGLLFIAAIALFTWSLVPRAAAAFGATALVFVAASPEGLAVLLTNWRDGFPLAYVREWNIDAATRIFYEGLSIDGLPRSLWYTPQHAGSCAFGLLALMVAAAGRPRRPVLTALAAGLLLAASVTFSPLPGGMFALIYGIGLVIRHVLFDASAATLTGRLWQLRQLLLTQLAAVIPVLLAVVACIRWEMVEGAGGLFVIGFYGYARHYPIATMVMSLGPALLPAVIGLSPLRRMPGGLVLAIVGCLAGTALFYLVTMPEGDQVWIGWRGGQILQVCLPPLIARGLLTLSTIRLRWLLPVTVALLFLIGLPTTVIDEYNAQDVTNDLMGPGFRWTVTLTPEEQEAMAWLRRTTSVEAVVQMDVSIRGRETWTLIPTFAQRRMMAGLPISLLPSPDYDRRAARVRRMFGLTDAEAAWKSARENRIDYFYVDRAERAAFQPQSLAKFDTNPEFFRPVFRNREVGIYAVVH
jgi:hypothetical protein